MRFLTDRKRAQGLGASGHGTHHHWQMFVSSILICVLIPLFIFTFGAAFGGSFEEIIAYYSKPFPAIVAALTLIVGVVHLMNETNVAVEDYVHGKARQLTIILVTAFSYTLIAAGLFALIKLAL